jgi:hypothetical protein
VQDQEHRDKPGQGVVHAGVRGAPGRALGVWRRLCHCVAFVWVGVYVWVWVCVDVDAGRGGEGWGGHSSLGASSRLAAAAGGSAGRRRHKLGLAWAADPQPPSPLCI